MSAFEAGVRFCRNALLAVTVAVVIVVNSVVLVAGYHDLVRTDSAIESTVRDILEQIRRIPAGQERALSAAETVFRDRVQSRTDHILDSNTLTFLLTVFSVALVSVGGYILSSSFANLTRAERVSSECARKVKQVGLLLAARPFASSVGMHLAAAHVGASVLKAGLGDEPTASATISLTRDALRLAMSELTNAARDRLSLNQSEQDGFMNRLGYTEEALKAAQRRIGQRASRLLTICRRCSEALDRGGFVQRYREQMDLIQAGDDREQASATR